MENLVLTPDQLIYYKSRLNPIVEGLVGTELCDKWWQSPNKAFDNKTPQQILETSDFYKVKHYLLWHAYGGGW